MNARVLMVVNADWFFLSHRVPLARALAGAGARVTVAAAPEAGRGREIEALGFTFEPIPLCRRSMHPFREIALLAALYRLCRRLRPDLVYHLTTKPVLYGTIAARAAGVPRVIDALPGLGYLFGGEDWRARVRRFVALIAYRIALSAGDPRLILQNSDDVALFVDGGVVAADRVTLVKGSGVNLDRFKETPEPDPPVTALFAARLLWDKGVGEFVEAARQLSARGVAARMLIAGEPDKGNPGHVPRTVLRGWHADGAIEWLGHVDDMAGLLSRCHMVVLPSYYREGVPRVLLEAGACGRPMVVADAPGSREVVRHRETGLLVPPRDAGALADAIQTLAGDSGLRRALGTQARKVVEREFDESLVIERTLEVFLASLSDGAVPRSRSWPMNGGDHEVPERRHDI